MKNKIIIGILIVVFGLVMIGVITYFLLGDSTLAKIKSFFGINKIDNTQVVNQPTKDNKINNNQTKPLQDDNNVHTINANNQIEDQGNNNIDNKKDTTKEDLQYMASSFTERFGSFSNQSDFANITDLKIYMTEKMKKWGDSYVNEQRQKGIIDGLYYSIITKTTAQEIKELDEESGKASVLVKCRRRESVSSDSNSTNAFDQNMIINFIKENGAWKIDSATWQAK
jgi:hypothetical protein